MQLIRLEASFGDMVPDGIYQVVDPYILEDFAKEAMRLPVGRNQLEDIYEDVTFWFTPKGWEEYGMYLLYLVSQPEAWAELQKQDIHLYINSTHLSLYYNFYEVDEYQVCLPIVENDGWYQGFEELTPDNIDEVCDRLKIKKGW